MSNGNQSRGKLTIAAGLCLGLSVLVTAAGSATAATVTQSNGSSTVGHVSQAHSGHAVNDEWNSTGSQVLHH